MEESLLEASRAFTGEEIRKIEYVRKQFETRSRHNDKEMFFKLIEEEKYLMIKLKYRDVRQSDLKRMLIQRIVKLYETLLGYYEQDETIWLAYVRFCVNFANPNYTSKVITKMLQGNTGEGIWNLAAKWELDVFGDIDKALCYLYKGIHYNAKASSLYMQIFKLELEYYGFFDPENGIHSNLPIEEQNRMSLHKVHAVYETVVKELPKDVELFNMMLQESTKYSHTFPLQCELCQYLQLNFQEHDIVWINLAQRELDGHHLTTDGKYEYIPKTQIEDRVKNAVQIYKQAIEIFNVESMWMNYLNSFVDLYCESKDNFTSVIKQLYVEACMEAQKNKFIEERHYIIWLDCIQDEVEMVCTLEIAIGERPDFLQLWVIYLRHYINKKNYNKLEELFNRAIDVLDTNCLPLWRLKIQYSQLQSNEEVEKVFKEGFRHSDNVRQALVPQYIEWMALHKNNELYTMYEQMANEKPFCFELHSKMAEIEAMKIKPKEETFKLIQKYIQNEPNVLPQWKQYILDEIHYGPDWRKDIYKKYLLNKTND